MSHFTKMKVQIKDRSVMRSVCTKMGWTIKEVPEYRNSYSGEAVKGAITMVDFRGTVKAVLDKQDNLIVDPYFMGRDYEKFCRDYAAESIVQAAMIEGGYVESQSEERNGDLVIEVIIP